MKAFKEYSILKGRKGKNNVDWKRKYVIFGFSCKR